LGARRKKQGAPFGKTDLRRGKKEPKGKANNSKPRGCPLVEKDEGKEGEGGPKKTKRSGTARRAGFVAEKFEEEKERAE